MRALLLLALATTGCSPGVFFVRSDGADLPVWVRGDPGADTMVVVQHGSGSSGFLYDVLPAFDALEERYAFAYWDQRGAGISQGNATAASLTWEASVDDLAVVVAALRQRYDPRRVVMLGHSLGGGISQGYLVGHDEGIHGYVDVSGGRSLREAYDIVRDEMITTGEAHLADPDHAGETAYWTEMVAFYQDTVDFPREEPGRSIHASYVERVSEERGFDYGGSNAAMASFLAGEGVRATFAGGFDVLAFTQNTAGFLGNFDFDGMDLAPADVAGIDVPTLVLAGRFDLSVPPEMSRRTWEAFAADHPLSRLVVLEASGHFPMWDEPNAFTDAVEAFVDDLP